MVSRPLSSASLPLFGRLHPSACDDSRRIAELNTQYADLPGDFADLSLITISERLDIAAIATLDSDFDIYRRCRKQLFERIFTPQSRSPISGSCLCGSDASSNYELAHRLRSKCLRHWKQYSHKQEGQDYDPHFAQRPDCDRTSDLSRSRQKDFTTGRESCHRAIIPVG
jgi:hypothetical protein